MSGAYDFAREAPILGLTMDEKLSGRPNFVEIKAQYLNDWYHRQPVTAPHVYLTPNGITTGDRLGENTPRIRLHLTERG